SQDRPPAEHRGERRQGGGIVRPMGKPTPGPVPMEALLAAGLPEGEGWQFEPQWDGFRCLARGDEDEVTLTPKWGKPLGRYFPDVVETLRALKDKHFLLDGE